VRNQAGTSYDPGALNYFTTYYWRIDAKNPGGTTTGDEWSFSTKRSPPPPPPPPRAFHWFPMESDPGWSTEGQWQFGIPLGLGSHNGDPAGGCTGDSVYGYNLAGDYTNDMPGYHLTAGPLDCSAYENVSLSFWRWLGVESATYDHADVEVSNNGTDWTPVWQHVGGSFSEFSWAYCEYDISALADGQSTVYVCWGMGYTDSSVTYPGWNIDDVALLGDLSDDLRVAPDGIFASSGYEGGPFDPVATSYTLTNTSGSSLDWTAGAVEDWVTVSPASGVLGAAQSIVVEVALNANAASLSPGVYGDVATFTNISSGFAQTRTISLTVLAVPGEIAVEDSIPPIDDLAMPFGQLIIGQSRTEQVTVRNTDPTRDLTINSIYLTGAIGSSALSAPMQAGPNRVQTSDATPLMRPAEPRLDLPHSPDILLVGFKTNVGQTVRDAAHAAHAALVHRHT
jgi:hypothetical protein